MTAIAALIHDGKVYMGADSAVSSGYSTINIDPQPKLWREANGMIIGSAGDCRAGDVMQYMFTPPPIMEGQDVNAYMRVTFPGALRACLDEHCHVDRSEGREDSGLHLLIGWRGQLWQLHGNYAVTQSHLPYMGNGSGGSLALAVLDATPELDPLERITRALQTAERFDAGVRAPFVILHEGED